MIVTVAQQGSKTKALPATVAVTRNGRVCVLCSLCFALSLSSSAVSRLGSTTSRLHRPRTHSSSTKRQWLHHIHVPSFSPRHHPKRVSASRHLSSYHAFHSQYPLGCRAVILLEAQHIAWCVLILACRPSSVNVVIFRTQRQTQPQAWLSPPLAISFVSRSATPSNDVSTTNAQEEVHPVLPQLVSLRRSCPICFAELTEHKHRGARLHNTGVHATIAAEPEAYAAIHKAKTCKRCWSQRAERTKYWLGHCEHLSGTQKVQ